MLKPPWAKQFSPSDRGHGSSYRKRRSTGCHGVPSALSQDQAGAPKLSSSSHRQSSSSMKAGPRLGGCFTIWGEAARGREPSCLAKDGWNQHMPAAPPQELLWGMPWRTMVWALQVLHACRDLSLKPTASNNLNLYYSSIDMLGECFFHSVPCAELYKTNIDLYSPTSSRGLCSSSCDGRCDWEDALHSHPYQMWSIQVSQGFLISLLDPYAAP